MMSTLTDLKTRFRELTGRDQELRAEARRALLDEYRAIQEELDALVPQLRERAWEAQQARRTKLQEEQLRLIRRRRSVRERLGDAEEKLSSARRLHDPDAAPLAATVEELKLEEVELDDKLAGNSAELRTLKPDEDWRGTRAELVEKLKDSNFFLDRDYARTMLRTQWRDERRQIYLKFRLDTGAVIDVSQDPWRYRV